MNIKDWKIVKSKSGSHPNGYPYGEMLCRDDEDVNSALESMHDPEVFDYKEKGNK